ncbi:hypothetical protein C7S18_12220 [Ahniella affigens]|uniref:Zinc finger DksA/TraR C4-type domain-containing protein n=1 Tax=Ahniella affigens TaxID=2021234 RepID=A0A2P1PST7_9GAMM|nr:hypothetical protein C7S18_12220 [Ahniella affigens]
MIDDVDRANDLADAERAASIAAILTPVAARARTNCIACGERISDARLAAVPFAQHCVDCANTAEKLERHRR